MLRGKQKVAELEKAPGTTVLACITSGKSFELGSRNG
jgi:hypothetical protein